MYIKILLTIITAIQIYNVVQGVILLTYIKKFIKDNVEFIIKKVHEFFPHSEEEKDLLN